jgi:hypothetical protein
MDFDKKCCNCGRDYLNGVMCCWGYTLIKTRDSRKFCQRNAGSFASENDTLHSHIIAAGYDVFNELPHCPSLACFLFQDVDSSTNNEDLRSVLW